MSITGTKLNVWYYYDVLLSIAIIPSVMERAPDVTLAHQAIPAIPGDIGIN